MFEFLDKLPEERRRLFAKIVAACFAAKSADSATTDVRKHVLRLIEDAATRRTRSSEDVANAD